MKDEEVILGSLMRLIEKRGGALHVREHDLQRYIDEKWVLLVKAYEDKFAYTLEVISQAELERRREEVSGQ